MTKPRPITETDPRLTAFRAGVVTSETALAIALHRAGLDARRAARGPGGRGPEPVVTTDARGMKTCVVDGFTVIRPGAEMKRFDEQPADVSAFVTFDENTDRRS